VAKSKCEERGHENSLFPAFSGEYQPSFVLEQERISLRKSTSPPVSLLVNQGIDELFSPDEQARTLREIRAISSSITKFGQEPLSVPACFGERVIMHQSGI
jgi:hypothetical protein